MAYDGNDLWAKKYPPTTDVFKATHLSPAPSGSSTTWSRKKYMDRSFISFSFGGKLIEDWNLLATISNDRMQMQGSAAFEDLTSTYEVVDGQLYWGTHYTTNQMSFLLATDGITQVQLDDFRHWFAPGAIRELILAEHPNRAIMARIMTVTVLSLLPFEEKTSIFIDEKEYQTSTTLYKGEIQLSFIMDEPFWYAKTKVFGYASTAKTNVMKESALTYRVGTAKVVASSSADIVQPTTQLASNHTAYIPEGRLYKGTWENGYNDDSIYDQVTNKWVENWTDANGANKSIFDDPDSLKILLEDGIPTASMLTDKFFTGNNLRQLGAIVGEAKTGEGTTGVRFDTGIGRTLASGETAYLYYPGNAPSAPTIQFTLTPGFGTNNYISSPRNNYTNSSLPYDTFTLRSINTSAMNYSLPSIWAAYNKAIWIFLNSVTSSQPIAMTELRQLIRDSVNHPAARAWAIKVVEAFGTTATYTTSLRSTALTNMKYFLLDTSGNTLSSTFTITCKTGEAVGSLSYRATTSSTPSSSGFASYGTITTATEQVGDMIKSDYLRIVDQNHLNNMSQILPWANTNDTTRAYSHVVSHNTAGGLSNIIINYDILYY